MSPPEKPLRILHVFRSPVGGLFRHVVDVAKGQMARDHHVGIVCDATTGDDRARGLLDNLAPSLALGLSRIPMQRQLGLGDLTAVRHVMQRVTDTIPDVVHGHGAKGAAYARLAVSAGGPLRVYTPHGGSMLFEPGTVSGRFYLTLEKLLRRRTDLFLFESAYIERLYRAKVGAPHVLARVVPNGVGEDEFVEVPPRPDATDLLYIGELRRLKGVDVLLAALANLRANGLALTLTIVGAGGTFGELGRQAQEAGLGGQVVFRPPTPAREAFALGRIMVVPSRLESFPYIVLEAAAAGKPLIATRVGGIPDMFGPYADRLIPPGDCEALARALADTVNHSERTQADARLLRERIQANYCLNDMVEGGIEAYRAALASRKAKMQ